MSGSTEIPDIIGGIINATGLKRLWQTDEQADSEKRESGQEVEGEKPTNSEETHQITQTPESRGNSGNATPVPINIECEKEQREPTEADHDVEVHGVPRLPTPPTSPKDEWPIPESLKENQTKMKNDSGPSQDERPNSWTDGKLQPSKDEEKNNSFVGLLVPTPDQQKSSSSTSQSQSMPLNKEVLFERPRPHSSLSRHRIDRPEARRQSTMPVRPTFSGSLETPEAKPKSAKKRWAAAANALRFPIRRHKTERRMSMRGSELINTLAAGAPAASIFGSHMIADEGSHSRIPVIVELLKVLVQISFLGKSLM
jgi:hypothetical protein